MEYTEFLHFKDFLSQLVHMTGNARLVRVDLQLTRSCIHYAMLTVRQTDAD